jgi:hypothetical protein
MSEHKKVVVKQETIAFNLETWAKELERTEYVQWSSDSLAMQQEAAKSFRDRMKRIASEIREHMKFYYGE